MFTIRQISATAWELVDASGNRVGDEHATYGAAVMALVPLLDEAARLAAGDAAAEGDDGLLPESWTSRTGIAFSEETGDGRDFRECVWTARDPNVNIVPLMLQTGTDVGHFGAELAGFAETIDVSGTPTASGRFYTTDAGRTFRDLLLGGRRFGVSVDPASYEVEERCEEFDDEGWCVDATWAFLAYEIAGITGTPFPGFAAASIELGTATAAADDAGDDDAADDESDDESTDDAEAEGEAARRTLAASAAPVAPPLEWFTMPEPQLGDPRLVEQDDGSLAVPLTITDEGQVYGHVARWGQCHVGFPGECVEPPLSDDEYGAFRTGEVVCAGGERVATGVLVAGADHAVTTLRAADARDHYAHNAVGWADVAATNGELGPWIAGALRPDVTELQLRVLRASSLSGDWRTIDGRLELIAALSVNVPGFGVRRRALVASGFGDRPEPRPRARQEAGAVVALVAAGRVRSCPGCSAAARRSEGDLGTSRELLSLVRLIERRTRPLTETAITAAAARIRG